MDLTALPSALTNLYFGIASVLCLLTLAISIWRFWFLVGREYSVSFFEIGKIVWASTFLNTFVPSGVSGDVYRGVRLRGRVPGAQLAVLIVFDKIMGLYTLILISALMFPWANVGIGYFSMLSWVIVAGGVVGFLSAKPLGAILSGRYPKIANIFFIVFSLRARALPVLLISLLAHLVGMLSIFFLALAIPGGGEIQLITTYAVTPYALIVAAFPLLPGGIGTGHLAFAFVFREGGFNLGADIFTLYLFLQCSVALAGSYFLTEKFNKTSA